MRLLTFRERDTISLDSSSDLLLDEIDALARLEPSLPKGLLNWGRNSLRFGPFCGVFRAGDLTVELLPKTGNADSARGVLVAMLRATNTLAAAPSKDSAIHNQRVHLLDQFIVEFCHRLEAELTKGAIAQYVQQEENQHTIRGRLNLTQHLRSNVVDRSRLHCRFDDRTLDNPYNHALKCVLHRLRSVATSSSTKGIITALTHRFDQVQDVTIVPADLEALRFDRLNRRWQSVFERAAWLVRGLFPDIRTGGAEGAGLLFNMEQLFERFIGLRIRQAWERHDPSRYEVRLQAPQRHLASTESIFLLRPDVTVLDDGVPLMILDTKWKDLGDVHPWSMVAPGDAYQMTTYAMRYGCQSVVLIYPSISRANEAFAARLEVPGMPEIRLCFVDIDHLALGGDLPLTLRP